AVDALRAAHRQLDPAAERIEIPFEGGKQLVGNLRRPAGPPAPLVLLLPGLDSTKEEFFGWENVFLARGLATFSLDGPGQGETGLTTHIYPNYEVAVTAAIDVLSARDDVDAGRVGAAGRSEEHTSELQSLAYLVCRLLLEKKKKVLRLSRSRRRLQ